MRTYLETLPLEILQRVIWFLDLSDYHSLSHSSRSLRGCLRGESTCRLVMKGCMSYSREYKSALRGACSFNQVALDAVRARNALAYGRPYSVSTIGYGSSMVYESGVLCYLTDQYVRIVDFYQSSLRECLLPDRLCRLPRFANLNLLHLSAEIAVFIWDSVAASDDTRVKRQLQVFDLCDSQDLLVRRRIEFSAQVPKAVQYFFRNDEHFCVYGYVDVRNTGSHGHHPWIIQLFDMQKPGETSPEHGEPDSIFLHLDTHPGTYIGSSVVFEIFDGCLFVVSSQDPCWDPSLAEDSFYHITEFRFRDANPRRPRSWHVWRRQCREGALNDNWTTLKIERDERDGALKIIEIRKEWIERLGRFRRCRYTTRLRSGLLTEMAEDCELTSSIPSLANYDNGLESPGMTPPPDPCKDSSSTLTGKRGHFLTESQGSAQNMPDVMFELEGGPPADPEYLCMHPEYHQDKQRQASREFLENRTPFKFYVATASVFLDLVFDEETSSKMAGHRRSIRLRIQSRKRKPVTSSSTGLPVPSEYSMKSEEAYPYVDMPTKLWPPNEASEELLTMINPYPNGQVVAAFADERRVIYMVRNPQSGSSSNNAIVLINFDPPPGREESQAKEEEKSTSRSCQGMKHVKKGVMVLPQDPLGTSPEKAIGPDRLILR